MSPQDHRTLYQKLTGRFLPIPLGDGEVPAPTREHMERFTALNRLVANPDFHEFLVFCRERAMGVLDGKKAASATDLELRSAKGLHESIAELGPMVLKFLQETEELVEERQKWLEQNQQNEETQKTETKP